ncbi:Aste57867_1211 [Aphanomyces stellatus]|uniref:Aste57867_1211 protein n=1 Tax=Aphanomyces stellatus TaxID=120398 RepID=A0A485K5P8_9STRA|nr:hypothetical protein As57867_001210 [Aphanomyces stellatus]VFT78431.1 Aste57867_1211 [Aphanomyces stellatus]
MRKKVVLVSLGSRGDVQPYCVLGQALAARGHDVVIATEKRMESLVTTEFQLPFKCILGDVCAYLFDPFLQKRLRTAGFLESLEIMSTWNKDLDVRDILASYEAALAGADIVVSGVVAVTESYCVAEKHRQVWIPLFLGNFVAPTSDYPQWIFDTLAPLHCGWLNKWTHWFLFRKMWAKQQRHIAPWRHDVLQLPPITSKFGLLEALLANDAITIYQGCSTLLAGPRSVPPTDIAPPNGVYTGFLFPRETGTGSSLLQAFLQRATQDNVPVIYVGFGSTPMLEPEALLDLVDQVCHMAKCRCVFALGWSATASITPRSLSVFVGTSLPHPWLFPQMRCIVHHAGLGTTAAALRSGVPQIPCPEVTDQFYNAKQLVRLGVALRVIRSKQLSAATLTKAVVAVLHNENHVRLTAQSIGEFVAEESNGNVDRLCDAILATTPTFGSNGCVQ